jgi:hypothetical protein
MRPRDFLLRASVLTLLAAAAITLLGDPTVAGELPPPSGPETAPFEVESHGDAPGAIAEASPYPQTGARREKSSGCRDPMTHVPCPP